MKHYLAIPLAFMLCASLPACHYFHAYRVPVQQGNELSADKVNQLKKGMSKQEVINLLDESILVDTFNKDRWTYVYTKETQHVEYTETRVVLYFVNDRVTRIER